MKWCVSSTITSSSYSTPFAVVDAPQDPSVLGQQDMAGIGPRQRTDHLDQAGLTDRALLPRLGVADHDIGEVQPRSIEGHSIVVHGFTHQQELKHRGDTLIVNPGEACGWLYGTPKAAILDLDAKKVEFLSLDPAHWTT